MVHVTSNDRCEENALKRQVSVLVALGALLTTAACGGGSPAGSGAAGSGGTAGSGGSGGSGGVATVGAILSLSGVYSTLGPPEQKAMTLGLEALNKTGFDVGGKHYTLDVKTVDDKSDAATSGVTAFRQLTQTDKVPLIAIGLGSSTYAPLLQRTPVPMINILDSTYPSILKFDDRLFLTRGESETYLPGCLDYAKTKLGVKTIATIAAKGEPYGEGLTELVKRNAPGMGLNLVGASQFPLGATDYGNAISAAVASKPDAVYLGSVTAVILPVLKQLRQSGYTGPVFHSSGVNPNQAKAILGADYNTIMKDNYDCAGTLPTTSSNPPTKAFAAAYQARYNEYPQDLTMWAYDFPFVVAEAMTKAGSTTDADKILKALPQMGVPKGSISGWIPGANGDFFTDRDARTASEVTTWCANKKTIASAMVFDFQAGKLVQPQYRDNPCAAVS